MGLFDAITDITDIVTTPLGLNKSNEEKAAQSYEESLRDLALPELKDLELQRYSEVGDPRDFLTKQADSILGRHTGDPMLKEAQRRALGQLQEFSAGQLTNADRARLQEINRENAIREQGQQQSIQQNARSRGIGGSGLELISSLAAQQQAADRANQQGLGVEQLAQQRALQSIRDSGALSGQIRGQEFDEATRRAAAQDLINQFNTDYANRAGLSAFANRQGIANQNVALGNNEQQFNRYQLPQDRYNYDLEKRQMIGDAAAQRAGMADARRSSLNRTVGTFVDPFGMSGMFGTPRTPWGAGVQAGIRGGTEDAVGGLIKGLPAAIL